MPPVNEAVRLRLVQRLTTGTPATSHGGRFDPAAWLQKNALSVEGAITGTRGFEAIDRGLLSRFLYPRLLAYALSCAQERCPSLLDSTIRQKQVKWATMNMWSQLVAFRSIQDTLWELIRQCDKSTTKLRQEGEKIAKNDALCIAAHVLTLLYSTESIRDFMTTYDHCVRGVLDLLQLLVDCPEVQPSRSSLIRIIRALTRPSERYPAGLEVSGVQKTTERCIGAGSFGEVWGGLVGNVAVAIKVIRHVNSENIERATKAFIREAVLWRQFSHPNILPFYGISTHLWSQDPRIVSLISPLMPHGNIHEYIRSNELGITERLALLVDVALGLEYLHKLEPPVIHGDIKLSNILVTQAGRACLSDFGLCTLFPDPTYHYTPTQTTTSPGAWSYRAPELLEERPSDERRKTLESDMYAFGCVCHELCVERASRFSHLSLFERYTGVISNRRMVQPTSMSREVWDMVEECWQISPSQRPVIGDALKILKGELRGYSADSVDVNPQWDLGILTYLHTPRLISSLHDRPELEADDQAVTLTDKDVIVALMGPTGTGKSSFVNIALQHASAVVGDELVSSTQDVRAFACSHPDGSGRRIILVDTPGFDDTYRTDYQILKIITDWLAKTYQKKITLSGILQFHAIDERKLRGTPFRNLAMFKDLCGEDALHNAVFITTCWDRVNEDVGSKREHQLRTQFWDTMTSQGSRVRRFSPRTYEKAWEIIDLFSLAKTAPLAVQREIVDEGKKLHETSAYLSLKRIWDTLVKKLKLPRSKKLQKRLRGG